MECNKEDAEKCKLISEAALRKHDLVTAKRFALKARQLYAELEGLAQLISIIEVHVSAREKLPNGESNWYSILQADFRADESAIRKQYRKLALFLHPDKNKSFAAEAAFKHISEAWSVLSDAKRKSDYDKRWRAQMTLQRGRMPYASHVPPGFQGKKNDFKQDAHGAHQRYQDVHHVQANRDSYNARQQQKEQTFSRQQQKQNQLNKQQKMQIPVFQHCQHQQQQDGRARSHSQEVLGQSLVDLDQQCQEQKQEKDACQIHCQSLPNENQSNTPCQTHVQEQGQINSQKQEHLQTAQHQEPAEVKVQQQQQQQQQKKNLQSGSQTQQYGEDKFHAFQQKDQGHVQQEGQEKQCSLMQQGLENLGSTQQSEAHAQQKGEAQADDQGKLHLHGQQESQHQGYDHQQQIQRKGSDHHQQDMEVSEGHQMNFKKPDVAPRRSTFWTACPACKMQYEYETIYMNKDLCCPICYAPFFSKEIQPKQGPILYDSAMQQFRKVQTMDSDGSNVSQKLHLNMNVEIGKEHISVQQNCQSSPRVSIGRAKTFSKELHDNLDGKTEDLDELSFRKKCQNMPGLMGSGSMSGNRSSSNLADQINISDLNTKIGVGFIEKGETILGADVSALAIGNKVGSKQIQDSLPTQNGTGTAVQNSPASNDDKRDSRLRTRYSIRNKDLPADSNCSPGSQVSKLKQSTSNNLTVSKKTENVNNIREKSTVGISNFKERIHQVAESQKIRGLQKSLYSSELDDSESETLLQKRKEVFPVTDHACDDVPMKKPRQDTKCESFSKFPTDKELEKSLLEKDSGKSCLSIDISSEFNDKYEMEVPDPDFHNFDEDRTENHFAVGQIWSTYDDDDGMPRYYARVDRILSARPLKLQMHWLEARDPSDEIRAWLNAGFQQSCGDFKLGSIYIADGVGTFSHLVNVDKVVKGSFKIYPRKGEVWALYKKWESLKVKDDKGGYDLIEIVTSFDEKNGVQGTPLLKVAGFKTIFERKDCMMCIPTHEIRRFSHRVPAHFTSAGDLPCINHDCIEIDPASVPLDLVIGEQ